VQLGAWRWETLLTPPAFDFSARRRKFDDARRLVVEDLVDFRVIAVN